MVITVPANSTLDLTAALGASTGDIITVEPERSSSLGAMVNITTAASVGAADADDGVWVYPSLQYFGSIRGVTQSAGQVVCLINEYGTDVKVRAYI